MKSTQDKIVQTTLQQFYFGKRDPSHVSNLNFQLQGSFNSICEGYLNSHNVKNFQIFPDKNCLKNIVE